MADRKTISNDQHEVLTAAIACGVKTLSIRIAKEQTESIDRSTIYKWIEENRGKQILITIE